MSVTVTHGVSVLAVDGWPVILTGWLAGRRAGDGWRLAWSASQEQTLSGTGARVYTTHRDWLGVVTGISAASTGGVLILSSEQNATETLESTTTFKLCLILSYTLYFFW